VVVAKTVKSWTASVFTLYGKNGAMRLSQWVLRIPVYIVMNLHTHFSTDTDYALRVVHGCKTVSTEKIMGDVEVTDGTMDHWVYRRE